MFDFFAMSFGGDGAAQFKLFSIPICRKLRRKGCLIYDQSVNDPAGPDHRRLRAPGGVGQRDVRRRERRRQGERELERPRDSQLAPQGLALPSSTRDALRLRLKDRYDDYSLEGAPDYYMKLTAEFAAALRKLGEGAPREHEL